MNPRISQIFEQSIAVKQAILSDSTLLEVIDQVTHASIEAYNNGKKLLFCGNGGSAADAQHLAAEFSGRFYKDRPPLYAEALHVNTSFLTAVANDYDFDTIYSRAVEAFGQKGDVLFAISTSGNSPNIIKAVEKARELGILSVAMSGKGGGHLKPLCDYNLIVPSDDTPRIQEAHITIGHIICELVEASIFQ
ncbi:MAG: D-sedoheptulose 7-phosphate isomerase [Bacteroidota bacterium]